MLHWFWQHRLSLLRLAEVHHLAQSCNRKDFGNRENKCSQPAIVYDLPSPHRSVKENRNHGVIAFLNDTLQDLIITEWWRGVTVLVEWNISYWSHKKYNEQNASRDHSPALTPVGELQSEPEGGGGKGGSLTLAPWIQTFCTIKGAG